ncbi:MAG: hypothetical protein J7578_09415 [Chitinophagaceae bacterium]|nr:hypothetical protein [Chitinophagaceae bacterium]
MKKEPENKKEAPAKPNQQDPVELPGMTPEQKKEENEKKKKEEKDAGPLGQENYSSPKNQSGKNTSPDSED